MHPRISFINFEMSLRFEWSVILSEAKDPTRSNRRNYRDSPRLCP